MKPVDSLYEAGEKYGFSATQQRQRSSLGRGSATVGGKRPGQAPAYHWCYPRGQPEGCWTKIERFAVCESIGWADSLHVLAVSPVGEAGGAEHLLLDVLDQLNRRGHEVRLLIFGAGPLLELAQQREIRASSHDSLVMRRAKILISGTRRLRDEVRKAPVDVLLLSHPKAHLISLIAGYRTQRCALLQVYDPPNSRDLIDWFSYHLPISRVAISARTAAAYARAAGRNDVAHVAPGVNVEAVINRSMAGSAQNVIRAAGLSGRAADVIMVSRLQRFKGVYDFIELAARISADQPDRRFIIVGPDAPTETGLRSELNRVIAVRGLNEVVGMAGYVNEADLAAALAAARCLVHPAKEESFGLVLVEAMSVGTPVVAYNGSGPSLILAAGGGHLVPSGNVQQLSQAVLRYLSDDERRQQDGNIASQRAMEFHSALLGVRYEQLLESLPGRASVCRSAWL